MIQSGLYLLTFVLTFSIPFSAVAANDKRTYPDDWVGYETLSELDWTGRSVRRGTFTRTGNETKSNRISIEIKVDHVKRLVQVNAKSREWRKSGSNPGGYVSKAMSGTTSLEKWNELIAQDAAILPPIAEPILEPDPDFIPSTRFCPFDEYYIEASKQNDEFWRRSSDECDEGEKVSAYFAEMVSIAFASFSGCDEYSTTTDLKLGLFNCIKNWGKSTN